MIITKRKMPNGVELEMVEYDRVIPFEEIVQDKRRANELARERNLQAISYIPRAKLRNRN